MVDLARAELSGTVVLPFHRVLNAMGSRGVLLLRTLLSSSPLRQTGTGERMMLKVACWPNLPNAVLAGRRTIDSEEGLSETIGNGGHDQNLDESVWPRR